MKIIGKTGNGFIVDISVENLVFLLGSFYNENIPVYKDNNHNIIINKTVRDLDMNDNIMVSSLYNMTSRLTKAAKEFIDANSAFKDTNRTMLEFSKLIVDNYNT